jgi:hypothetical protein
MSFIVGLDLGQSQDPPALMAIEATTVHTSTTHPITGEIEEKSHPSYSVRAIESYPLGIKYPELIEMIRKVVSINVLRGCPLVVDYTGCGRPVVDMMRRASLPAYTVPIGITAGMLHSFDQEEGVYRVPKKALVSALQVVLQQGRLQIAKGLKAADKFAKELQNFRVKITASANETFDGKTGTHDDLVSAAMLAIWYGENAGTGTSSDITVSGVPFLQGLEAKGQSILGTAPSGVWAGGGSGHDHGNPNIFGGAWQ